MDANRYLIYGVTINGVRHPLRFKWYDDVDALVKTMCDWLPIIALRSASGGVNAGHDVSEADWHGLGVHIAYWYDDSMYYYVEHSDTPPDFCPSPAIAHDFDNYDLAPQTVTQAQAFMNLWDAVREGQRREYEQLSYDEKLRRQLIAAADQDYARRIRGEVRRNKR